MESKSKSEKIVINNVCCFGADLLGVSTACVIAHMCPFLKVAVVDFTPDKVSMWNMKQIPITELGMEDMIKKTQNNNLFFTADIQGAVREANLIIVSLGSVLKHKGSGEGKVPDWTDLEKFARLIVGKSQKKKIIVERGPVLPGNSEILSSILKANANKHESFEILCNPDFSPEGKILEGLINPEKILIGSAKTPSGLEAAESLAAIYSNWVPREKIMTTTTIEAELIKLFTNAFIAQRLSSLGALTLMCEAAGTDVKELLKLIGGSKYLSSKYLEPTFGFGGPHLQMDVNWLIHICESSKFAEAADYWKSVLNMNELQQYSFKKKILSCFYNTLVRKKFAIWGMSFKNNSAVVTDSPAVHLCRSLLEEGAMLSIYDPQVEKKFIIEELKDGTKDLDKVVTVVDSPYKSTIKCNGIIVCTDWEEFNNINFEIIIKDMMKPPYIFDGRRCLPHEKLTELGFVYKTIGINFN